MNIRSEYKVAFDGGWSPEQVRDALCAAKSIVLVAHQHADGDAVGSLTGMYALLGQVSQAKLTMMLPDGCPDELSWLPNTSHILNAQTDIEACRLAIGEADLVVVLDLGTLERTGVLADAFAASAAPRLLVDHHLGPDREAFATVVSEPDLSSTCELVYWLMDSAFGSGIFGRDAATSLFTGICTDTGTFSYSNDRQSVYLAAASLLQYGIDPMDITRRVKNVFTTNRLRFFGHAMADLLQVYDHRQVALMAVTAADMESHGVGSEDVSGLINEVMRLRDVDCAVLVREEQGPHGPLVRLSLRSKTIYDVSAIARELFGGGGHERAAGATSRLTLKETVAIVKQRFKLDE